MMTKHTPADFGKVVVLMGGDSAEREISLITGQNILEALKRNGIDAHGLDVQEDVIQKLQTLKPNRAFIALHGPRGEDGVIQGLLEYLKIPYTGSGVAASAITMNKPYTKWIWESLGIPTPAFVLVDTLEAAVEVMMNTGLPLCIKPIADGSSVGVHKVSTPEQLPDAFNSAIQFGNTVMIEPWIDGSEYTVGILGNQALPVIEIQTDRPFYDFDAKYNEDSTHYICPTTLAPETEQELQNMAMQAFTALGCRDWGRVDVMADYLGNFWFLEVNTIPGMTDHSLVPKAAKALNISFDELVIQILSFTL